MGCNQRRLRVLEVGAQPADVAGGFFAGAFGVEGDEAVEQGFAVGRGEVGPAVGGEHGGVEFVVQGLQDGDEALFVDGLVLGGQRLAAAQIFASTL